MQLTELKHLDMTSTSRGEDGSYKVKPIESNDPLSTLDPKFFTKDFDPIVYVLDTLPIGATEADLDLHLQTEIGRMDIKTDIVLSRLAGNVQDNYTAFIQGMRQVQQVDLDISRANIHVRNGRRNLATIKRNLVTNHLQVVRKRRNLDRMQKMASCCTFILDCFKMERDMHGYVEQRQFALAAQICTELRKKLAQSQPLHILTSLTHRMKTALLEMQYQFDAVLQEVALEFNAVLYAKLIDAYHELESHSKMYPQLSGRITEIPRIVQTTILQALKQRCKFAMIEDQTSDEKRSDDPFFTYLTKCFKYLLDLMFSYDTMIEWHQQHLAARDDVIQELSDGRAIIWNEMQKTIGTSLETRQVAHNCKLEHMVVLCQATGDFNTLGGQFSSGETAPCITNGLKQYCTKFLDSMHMESIELIKMLLDTENWQRIPCYLDEYGGMLALVEQRCGYHLTNERETNFTTELKFSSKTNLFIDPVERYDLAACKKSLYSTGNASLGLDEEVRRQIEYDLHAQFDDATFDTAEDMQLRKYGSKHVVSTAALSGFVRLTGNYIKVMQQLPLIAAEACFCIFKVFDIYFYSTAVAFIPEKYLIRIMAGTTPSDLTSDQLKQNIERIRKDLNLGQRYIHNPANLSRREQEQRLPAPFIHVPAMMQTDTTLFALAERSVAAESLVFMLDILQHIRPLLEQNGSSHATFISTSLDHNVICVAELRSFIYASIAPSMIRASDIPQMIATTVWDVRRLSEEHNPYVVTLVRECGDFWGRLQTVADGSIPIGVRDEIWQFAVRAIMESLVEGFANVSNCTAEGRALMSMDFQALQNGLDLINHTSTCSVYGRSYVTNFIQAFYFNPQDLQQWIQANKDKYQRKHLTRLVINGIGPSMKRKTLQMYLDTVGLQ